MGHPLNLIRRVYSRADLRASWEHPGRPAGRVPGGWIADLIGCQRALILCAACDRKFHPKKNHYVTWSRTLDVVGTCDGCRARQAKGKMFIHESTYDEIAHEGGRRRGRWVTSGT